MVKPRPRFRIAVTPLHSAINTRLASGMDMIHDRPSIREPCNPRPAYALPNMKSQKSQFTNVRAIASLGMPKMRSGAWDLAVRL